jgi:hypothetical protein
MSSALTSSQAFCDLRRIVNRNSASSQVGSFPSGISAFGASTSEVVTGALDTSTAQNLVFTGQLALATETITLESYTVEILP